MALTNGLIHPENTALVVVDLQEKLTPAISGINDVLANTKKLLHLAKILPLQTLVTTQYSKGLGGTVSEIAKLFEAEPIDKICFDCLGDDAFDRHLNAALPDGGTVVLCGIEAHICVNQTLWRTTYTLWRTPLAREQWRTGRSASNACATRAQ